MMAGTRVSETSGAHDSGVAAVDERRISTRMRWLRARLTEVTMTTMWRMLFRKRVDRRRMTLFARSAILMTCEVLLNAVFWIVAAIVFLRGSGDGHRILGLALVAWTTGLRHGLDADHISAIDNATRRIVSVPRPFEHGIRRPVTVGLFFSLGHSTIVICTTIAIAVSANVADRLDGFGEVGGIVGASVSSSFLILIGCINTIILYKTWKRLKSASRIKKRGDVKDTGNDNGKLDPSSTTHFNGLMTRIAMPLLRSVDRPWKMYPVGVLFGLGFDTASSIALLSVATIAQQDSSSAGQSHNNANVVVLAFLFTAGMTLVDSADSCLMIWAYAPDLERNRRFRYAIWEEVQAREVTQTDEHRDVEDDAQHDHPIDSPDAIEACNDDLEKGQPLKWEDKCNDVTDRRDEKNSAAQDGPVSHASLRSAQPGSSVLPSLDVSASRISLLLTLLSIAVAFSIGFIVLLGLIGDQCARCSAAADREEQGGNGGLEGRWWLAWRRANDNSGYVGAGIVGAFAVCVAMWFIVRAVLRRRQE